MNSTKETYIRPSMEIIDLEVSESIMGASQQNDISGDIDTTTDTGKKDFWGN